MGRKPRFTDDELELLAYAHFKNTGQWPQVQIFMADFPCSCERATRAIRAAQTTATAAVEASLFDALAVYAGFKGLNEARSKILSLLVAPGNLARMKKQELRASVVLLCPEEYSPRHTAAELRDTLKRHGYGGNRWAAFLKRQRRVIVPKRARAGRPAAVLLSDGVVEGYRREREYARGRLGERRTKG